MKKLISIILIFALCLTMFACGDNTHKDKPINSSDDKIKIDTWEDYFGHTVEEIIDLYGNKYSQEDRGITAPAYCLVWDKSVCPYDIGYETEQDAASENWTFEKAKVIWIAISRAGVPFFKDIKIGDSFDSINSKCENKLELEEHYLGYSEEPDGTYRAVAIHKNYWYFMQFDENEKLIYAEASILDNDEVIEYSNYYPTILK